MAYETYFTDKFILKPREVDQSEGKVSHCSDRTDSCVTETRIWDSLVIWLG